jgi:hypothetical protein
MRRIQDLAKKWSRIRGVKKYRIRNTAGGQKKRLVSATVLIENCLQEGSPLAPARIHSASSLE